MKLIPHKLGLCTLTLALMASCSRSGSDSANSFQFSTSSDVNLTITVLHEGNPVTGASVSLADPMDADSLETSEEETSPNWYQGITTTSGVCTGVASVAARVSELDLIIHAPGLRGPYTVEELRTRWSVFAPSARVRVTRNDDITMTINLETAE